MDLSGCTPSATVLVVDDDDGNRALAQNALRDDGYRVLLADDGREGLATFEAHRPECVLLDIRMSAMDGFAVCEHIRTLPLGADTPILFLTAQRDVETFDRALRAGGDDFLTKPVSPTELVNRVRTALRLRTRSAELREHLGLLKDQRDGLLRLQLQKERLIAFAVHDLRTPVTTMLLQEELLLHENGLSARGREHARRIGAAARRLDAMILNLLDISKADEGRLVPRLADLELSSLVEDVLLELSVQARSQNVFLRSSLSIGSVHVDHDLFRRTLLNLVENAIRYAPPETQITLTAVRFGSTTEIRVTDNGNGVPSEMREIVFEPFEQGDASGVDVHGSRGLGLAFCKRVVEAHRGRIWIEDREDGAPGAVFAISLPHPDESRVTPTPTNWSC